MSVNAAATPVPGIDFAGALGDAAATVGSTVGQALPVALPIAATLVGITVGYALFTRFVKKN